MADKKRRDKGDGCISQRADGTWTARIRVGLTPEGKPKIKAFYGKSEREVKKKLKEFEKEMHKNDMSVVQRGTVESYMLNWLRSVKSNELKALSPRYIDRMLRKIAIFAGFAEEKIYGLHSLRHTFASRLFENGEDVKTVSEILAHSDITITYNTYIHLINDQKKTAIANINKKSMQATTAS